MKKILLMGFSIALASLGHAAKPIDLSQKPLSFFSNTPHTLRGLNVPNTDESLKESARLVDSQGILHISMYQTYAGYRVFGTDAIVHTPQSSVTGYRSLSLMLPFFPPQNTRVDGVFYQDLAQDLQQVPEVVFNARQQAVRRHLLHLVQTRYGDHFDLKQMKVEPMIYIDEKQQAHYAFYAALVLLPTQTPLPVEPVYILDASDFTVYKNWNNVKSEAVKGGGLGGNPKKPLIYDGRPAHLPPLEIERDTHQQICLMKNTDGLVFDFDRIGSWEKMGSALTLEDGIARFACESVSQEYGNLYWNADFDKQNEGYSPNNDALFAANTVQAMFQTWYQMDVKTMLNGADKPQLKMVTHIADFDSAVDFGNRAYHPYENAFWSDYFNAIFLGDGGDAMYPLTALDVMVHEISHGITSHRKLGGLVYADHSGALNESFSDMAAQAAQYFVYGTMDGQIGAELMKTSDQALRYMDKPSRDCGEDRQPGDFCSIDHVSQYQHLHDMAYRYTSNEEEAQSVIVHYASGVFNRAFYRLATTPGWDPEKAFRVMVWANLYEWRATTDFNCAGKGVINAAVALKYDTHAVMDALNQVGIKPACRLP